jgi:hypothetical protein
MEVRKKELTHKDENSEHDLYRDIYVAPCVRHKCRGTEDYQTIRLFDSFSGDRITTDSTRRK